MPLKETIERLLADRKESPVVHHSDEDLVIFKSLFEEDVQDLVSECASKLTALEISTIVQSNMGTQIEVFLSELLSENHEAYMTFESDEKDMESPTDKAIIASFTINMTNAFIKEFWKLVFAQKLTIKDINEFAVGMAKFTPAWNKLASGQIPPPTLSYEALAARRTGVSISSLVDELNSTGTTVYTVIGPFLLPLLVLSGIAKRHFTTDDFEYKYTVGEIIYTVNEFGVPLSIEDGIAMAQVLSDHTGVNYVYYHTTTAQLHMAAALSRLATFAAEGNSYAAKEVSQPLSSKSQIQSFKYPTMRLSLMDTLKEKLQCVLDAMKQIRSSPMIVAPQGLNSMAHILHYVAVTARESDAVKAALDAQRDINASVFARYTQFRRTLGMAMVAAYILYGEKEVLQYTPGGPEPRDGPKVVNMIKALFSPKVIATADSATLVYPTVQTLSDKFDDVLSHVPEKGALVQKVAKMGAHMPLKKAQEMYKQYDSKGVGGVPVEFKFFSPTRLSALLKYSREHIRKAEVDKNNDRGNTAVLYESARCTEITPDNFFNPINLQQTYLAIFQMMHRMKSPFTITVWEPNTDGGSIGALATFMDVPFSDLSGKIKVVPPNVKVAPPYPVEFRLEADIKTYRAAEGSIVFNRVFEDMPPNTGWHRDTFHVQVIQVLAETEAESIVFLCSLGAEWEYLISKDKKVVYPLPVVEALKFYDNISFVYPPRLHNGRFYMVCSGRRPQNTVAPMEKKVRAMANWSNFSAALMLGMYVFNALKNFATIYACTAPRWDPPPQQLIAHLYGLTTAARAYQPMYSNKEHWGIRMRHTTMVSGILASDDMDDFSADVMEQYLQNGVADQAAEEGPPPPLEPEKEEEDEGLELDIGDFEE